MLNDSLTPGKKILWQDALPPLSASDLAVFERKYRVTVPADAIWFMTHVVNDGFPRGDVEFIVEGMDFGEIVDLAALYGIGPGGEADDLETSIECEPKRRMRVYWPLGRDSFNSQFYLAIAGPHKGQVRYMDWCTWCEKRSLRTVFVASDIREFAKMVRAQVEFPEKTPS